MPPPTGVAPVSAARLPQREQSPAPFSGRGVPPRPVAKQAEVETEPETKFGGVPVAKKAVSAEGEADQGAQSSASGGTASQGTKKRCDAAGVGPFHCLSHREPALTFNGRPARTVQLEWNFRPWGLELRWQSRGGVWRSEQPSAQKNFRAAPPRRSDDAWPRTDAG